VRLRSWLLFYLVHCPSYLAYLIANLSFSFVGRFRSYCLNCLRSYPWNASPPFRVVDTMHMRIRGSPLNPFFLFANVFEFLRSFIFSFLQFVSTTAAYQSLRERCGRPTAASSTSEHLSDSAFQRGRGGVMSGMVGAGPVAPSWLNMPNKDQLMILSLRYTASVCVLKPI
jgi:hypothetical protein